MGITGAAQRSGYAVGRRSDTGIRGRENVDHRWVFPFAGMEELSFKRVPDGWIYRAPNPWLFGSARYYLVSEAQKSELAGLHRRMWRYLLLAIVAVAVVGVPLTALWLDGERPYAMLVLNAVIGGIIGFIWNACLFGAVRPIIAGLQPTTQRITPAEAIDTQVTVFSARSLLFFALLSAAMFALSALPPLFGAIEWSVWSACGALLFGVGAAYWLALYIAKRKRSAP
jgi:hypothetical protein